PARAIAIAISDSVTVSIAAATRGTLRSMLRVNRDAVSTSRGCVVECRGTRRTSSKVSATSMRTRDADESGTPTDSLIRESPLPGPSRATEFGAGFFGGRVVVAMAECRLVTCRRPVLAATCERLPPNDAEPTSQLARQEERGRGEHRSKIHILE